MTLVYSWYIYWKENIISVMKNKISDIEIINDAFGSSGYFKSRVGSNLLVIKHLQLEGENLVQNRQLFVYQFINHNLILHTIEDTSSSYLRKFLEYLSNIFHKKLAMLLLLFI